MKKGERIARMHPLSDPPVALFYKIMNWLGEVKIPENFLTVRLMTRKFTQNLIQYQEREMEFGVLTELVGFRKKSVVVHKLSTSPTNYSLPKKFNLMVNAITSSTNRPLWVIFYLGLGITLASSAYIVWLFINRFVYGMEVVEGWTSIMVSIFLIGGLNIFVLGIIGIYLSKVFIETKQRPYSIIRQIYGKKTADFPWIPFRPGWLRCGNSGCHEYAQTIPENHKVKLP